MNRAVFFSKMVYESKVTAKNRSAFLKMSWDMRCSPPTTRPCSSLLAGRLTFCAGGELQPILLRTRGGDSGAAALALALAAALGASLILQKENI